MVCSRCGSTGFLNLNQVDEETLKSFEETENRQGILDWIKRNDEHDVQVCDCCGDGESWHDVPGEHYNNDDPPGPYGPYAYNGGLCECN